MKISIDARYSMPMSSRNLEKGIESLREKRSVFEVESSRDKLRLLIRVTDSNDSHIENLPFNYSIMSSFKSL